MTCRCSGQPRGIETTPAAIKQISSILASGKGEPLAHELIREAFDVVARNPRSALLIGVTALETGVKDYMRFRIPDVDPLLEEMPSPSVEKMIQKVVPAHKAQNVVPHFPLKKSDYDFLKKWMFQRNRVTHGAQQTINTNDLIEFLQFARRLLYKIDVCRGDKWAEPFCSIEDEYLD